MASETGSLVVFKTCLDLTEAHIVRGVLETNDIECFLIDEHLNSVAYHLTQALGGVRVMVHADDIEQCHHIMAAQQKLSEAENITPTMYEKRPFFRNMALVLFGLFSGAPLFYPRKAKK